MSELRRLYEAAAEIAPEARTEWLMLRCPDADLRAKVFALLQFRPESTSPLDRPAADRLAALDPETSPARVASNWAGRRIGSFRLRSLIGEGGMAAVFDATREGADFDQRVAVKLLKRAAFSEYEQRSFKREQQALASLEHPNIARLIDGGVTDEGTPFLVMELVDGETITHYCEDRRACLRTRLGLFLTVCRAVDAAHRALIVHRDIKPSNILVTGDGVVKLLDFGIAKMLDDEHGELTRTGLGALTPEYAAPEQFIGGTVTTATDTYALGVLLHELLTGTRPGRAVGTRPSDLLPDRATSDRPLLSRRTLRGDLDNIVLKALDADPARRYSGARALAEDIERYLGGQPVLAHPPSRWYRATKFVDRHRGGVTVGFVLGIAVLVSLASALWQAHVARQQAARADSVRDFVVDLLRQTAPSGPASERPDVPALVYEAAAKLPTALRDQPLVRAELLVTLGNVLRNMNDPRRSEGLLRLARADLDVAGIDDRLRLEADVGMARTLNKLSRHEEARALLLPWLTLPERRLPPEARRATLLKLAMAIDASAGKTEDALRLGSEMIAAYERDCARGIACDELGYAQFDYGMTLVGASRLTPARALLQASLSSKRAARVHLPSIADSIFGLSLIHGFQGDLDPAEAFARESMSLQRSLGDSVRTPLQAAQQQLAEVLIAKGDHAQALQLLSEIVDRPRDQTTGACAIASTMLYSAIARIELAQSDAALRDAASARTGAMSCPPGNRLLIVETADLISARARLASGGAAATRAPIDAASVDEVVSRRAGPGRQLTYLLQALRLAVELDDPALTRAVAGHLLGLMNTIDANAESPSRVEAELAQARAQGTDPETVATHFEPLLRSMEEWPIGQRLNRQWLAWRASAGTPSS